MDIEKFRNSKRRFLASIIDGVMLALPPMVVLANVKSEIFIVYFSQVYMFVPLLYSILCNFYYGQTLGKSVLDLKVVDNFTEDKITLKQAIYRDGPWVLLTILSVICFTLVYIFNLTFIEGFNSSLSNFSDKFNTYWFLIEMITMFTNYKRRAVHDYLAGTVVIRIKK